MKSALKRALSHGRGTPYACGIFRGKMMVNPYLVDEI